MFCDDGARHSVFNRSKRSEQTLTDTTLQSTVRARYHTQPFGISRDHVKLWCVVYSLVMDTFSAHDLTSIAYGPLLCIVLRIVN